MTSQIHKQYLYPAILFNVFSVIFLYGLFHEGVSVFYLVGLVLCLFLGICSVLLLWKYRIVNTDDFALLQTERIRIKITANELLFPVGYYFRQSSIYREKCIPASRINEVNLNTFPPSVVIDNKEVIFLEKALEAQLKEFAVRNKIGIVGRYDIWGGINDPFLDTEFTEEEKARTIGMLAENGISPEETVAIRKKIRFAMYSGNCYAWEWVYLGQFDYLEWSLRTRKNYWWSMEIALRNYQPKESADYHR